MSKLMIEKLLKVLQEEQGNQVFNYTIPDLWNCFDYSEDKFIRTPSNELMVNPYEFYQSVIKDYILPKVQENIDYSKSISIGTNKKIPKTNYVGGDWIKESVVYSTMIRTSSAWDSDRSGKLETENIYKMPETGSFVKMLILPCG